MPVKTDSKKLGITAIKEETNIKEELKKDEKTFRDKDGTGYGDLQSTNITPNLVTNDPETFVGKPAPSVTKKTYIQPQYMKSMVVDQNKLTHTRVGDYIDYYENGVADKGVVAKMGGSFITIFKEDGTFHNIHINDTFFIKDILINKTWNNMSMEEKTEQLIKIKAYSPRYLAKTWEELPQELRDVMKKETNGIGENDETTTDKPIMKSDVERGVYGTVGGRSNVGVSTDTPFDADKDYEGASHRDYNEQFKHEEKKPETSKTGHKKTKSGEFVYTDNPNKYKIPVHKSKGWGMRYGVKYINEEDDD